eukprot:jgi/Galph1/452/GphlegSOOS_G5183.1
MQTPRTNYRRALPFPAFNSIDKQATESESSSNAEILSSRQGSVTNEGRGFVENDVSSFIASYEQELEFEFFSALSGSQYAIRSAECLSAEQQILFIVTELQLQLENKLQTLFKFLKDRSLHPRYREELEHVRLRLQAERDTWYLLKFVTVSSPTDSVTKLLQPPTHVFQFQNASMLKARCILEWCEKICVERLSLASDGRMADVGQRVEERLAPLDDPAYRWSQSALQAGKTMLDPDYPFREHELHQVDRHMEETISYEFFCLLRSGMLEKAAQVLEKVGQYWRSICLLGFCRAWSASSNGEIGEVWKNWKRAAEEIALNPLTSTYEKGVFGALCGRTEQVLSACRSWEDYVWIRFFSRTLQNWENILFSGEGTSFTDEDILEIFEKCEGTASDSLELNMLHRIQSYLSLGLEMNTNLLLRFVEFLLATQRSNEKWCWFLRFTAQVTVLIRILFKRIENEKLEESLEQLLLAYCSYLLSLYSTEELHAAEQGFSRAKLSYDDLLMGYVANLRNEQNIVDCCVEFMLSALKADIRTEQVRKGLNNPQLSVVSDERRTSCLEKTGQYLAEFPRSMLNCIVETSVSYIWNEIDFDIEQKEQSNDADLLVIRSVDFLIFPGYENYMVAVACINLFVRKFVLAGRISSAHLALAQISDDMLRYSENEWSLIHEFRCWQQFLVAWDAIVEWRQYFVSQRPSPLPASVVQIIDYQVDDVSLEEQLRAQHLVETYEEDLNRYQEQCWRLGEIAADHVISTLTFEGGWLCDPFPYQTPSTKYLNIFNEAERKEQLRNIRQQYIPLMISQLVDIYKQIGKFESCLTLLQILADDSFHLLSELTERTLKPCIQQISEVYLDYCDTKAQKSTYPFLGEIFEDMKNTHEAYFLENEKQ